MKEIKLTQGKVALVDDRDYDYLTQWRWHVIKGRHTFYAKTLLLRHPLKFIFMHRAILNLPIDVGIDHANGNGLDNRKQNLRICTNAENSRNSFCTKNKTGYKGVTIINRNGRKYIIARITIEGKLSHIGSFKTVKDAALAYNEAAKKIYGEFARLNIIE